MAAKKPLIFVTISIIIFFCGIFVGMNDFLTENYSSLIKKSTIDSLDQTQVPVIDESSLNNLINFKNETEVLEKRYEIINYIWKSDELPNDYPTSIESNFVDIRYSELENLKTMLRRLELIITIGSKHRKVLLMPKVAYI